MRHWPSCLPAPTVRSHRLISLLIIAIILTACAPRGSAVSTQQSIALEDEPRAEALPVGQAAPEAAAIDSASGSTIMLEDAVWTGGFRQTDGSLYGGRSAIWLSGANSTSSTIETTFRVEGRPAGEVELIVAGMDAPGGSTPLSILINDIEVYACPAATQESSVPLPDANWDVTSYIFDAAVLQPGINRITISNSAPTGTDEPPIFGIDYAEIIYESQES